MSNATSPAQRFWWYDPTVGRALVYLACTAIAALIVGLCATGRG